MEPNEILATFLAGQSPRPWRYALPCHQRRQANEKARRRAANRKARAARRAGR